MKWVTTLACPMIMKTTVSVAPPHQESAASCLKVLGKPTIYIKKSNACNPVKFWSSFLFPLPFFLSIVYPEMFSSCSQQQLSMFLEEINPECLLDTPSTDRIFGGPVCGNAFLESGEECDCGTVEVYRQA